MKKLALLLLFTGSLQLFAITHGQVKISVRDAPLEKVFDIIKRQAGVHFFYQQKDIVYAKKVTMHLENASVATVLDKALEGQELTYAIDGKNVFIKKVVKPSVVEAILPDSLITVQGKVLNNKQEAIQGATITVKETNKITLSNDKGEFRLMNVSRKAILLITSVNYSPQEIRVNGKSDVELTLDLTPVSLQEVVVMNTGYQQISKERFVGSVAVLDSLDYSRRPGSDIISRLDGMIPGILFDKKSPFTSQLKTIQIRGFSTLNSLSQSASTEPLIVVDNFPFKQDLNSLNPNDIESITVLKDAAATSIWGAQAGNGVIVITTKKAKYNQPFSISLSSNLTLENKPDPFFMPQMSISDYVDGEVFLFRQGRYDDDLNNNYTWPGVSPVVEMLSKRRAGEISEKDSAMQIAAFKKMDLRNDLNKWVYRSGFQQQYYLNLAGGNNIFNYAISGGYNRNSNTIQNSKPDEQFTLNVNSGIRIVKNLEFRTGVSYSQGTIKSTSFNIQGMPYQYAQLADDNGNPLALPVFTRLSYLDTAGGGELLDWKYRPLQELRLADNKINNKFILLSAALNYKITQWLTAGLNYQYSSQTSDTRNFYSRNAYATRDLVNTFTNLSETDPDLRNPVPYGNILDLINNEFYGHNIRGRLDVNHSFSNQHQVTAFVAGELSEMKGKGNSNRFYAFNPETGNFKNTIDYNTNFPVFGNMGNQYIPNGNLYIPQSNRRLISLLSNISYTYDGRYTVYLSGRKDGSNVFGVKANNKWKPLWSAGAGWDISREKFFTLTWMDMLKLRTSYGISGNPGNATGFPTIKYNTDRAYLTNLVIADVQNAPNPYLSWEKVKTFNLGIDFSLWKNRLSGSVEFYHKKASDILWSFPPAPSTGMTGQISNSADLKGRGLEISLRSVNINRAVRWESVLNFSHARTTVVKVSTTQYQAQYFMAYGMNPSPGELAYGISSFRFAGLDPETGDPLGYHGDKVSKNYTDILNDSLVNQKFHGSAIPLYFGNLNNTVSWKNFSLYINISYRLGFYYRKPTISYSDFAYGRVGNPDYALRWQQAGDEKHTTVPSFLYPLSEERDQFYKLSEVNVLRGDNIRLNDISLRYSPELKWKNPPIKSLIISFTANRLNAILWKKDKSDYDPDFTGGDGYVAPVNKWWTLGINMNF